MGFLKSIQADLIDHNTSVASTLLKLRLLAAKLGSSELTEWIKFESEGCPNDIDIPAYRVIPLSVLGTFRGPAGSGVQNAPIPSLLIKQIAGDGWDTYNVRESAATVEKMADQNDGLRFNLSNLMITLRGKIYPGYEPAQIVGLASQTSLIEVSNAIRTRLLEVTIEIAAKIPAIEEIELASITQEPEVATQIFHQTIHGNMTNIQSSGPEATLQVTIVQHNTESLKNGLLEFGLSEEDSDELSKLISKQKPKDKETGLNKGVRKWLADRITNSFNTEFQGGISTLIKFVQEAAIKYWGL